MSEPATPNPPIEDGRVPEGERHYAMLVGSAPPSAEVIAHGTKNFVEGALDLWVGRPEFKMPEYTTAMILKVVTEVEVPA